MNIVSQTQESTTLEMTPLELEIFRTAINREHSFRGLLWKHSNPSTVDEITQLVTMKSIAYGMKSVLYKAISPYRK